MRRIGWRGGQLWKWGDDKELPVIIQVRGAGGSQQVLEAGEQVVECRHPLMAEPAGGADRMTGCGCMKERSQRFLVLTVEWSCHLLG